MHSYIKLGSVSYGVLYNLMHAMHIMMYVWTYADIEYHKANIEDHESNALSSYLKLRHGVGNFTNKVGC